MCKLSAAAALALVAAAQLAALTNAFLSSPSFSASTWRSPQSSFAPAAQRQHQRYGARRPRSVSPLCMAADFYQTLGVGRTADVKDIKSAYRKLAREFHPDVNPNGEEKFKEINRAYEVLSDPEMRQRYDQFGEAGLKGGMGGGPGGMGDVDLSDIFDSFFGGGMRGGRGGGARSRAPVRGDDLRVDLDLDFKTACFGSEEKVRIRHLETCDTCTGSGAKPGAKVSTCDQCGGQGVVIQVQRTPLGAFQTQTSCPVCRGSGQRVEEYCGTCGGRGLVETAKQVKVKIPAGVDTGTKLRVRNEGDAAKGAPSGDLYVFLNVKSHPTFTRKGSDIYADKTISYLDAILGNDAVRVDVVDGEVEIKVPPGTQPSTVLRIRGKGAPVLGGREGERGDHYVTVKVDLPKSVSDEERKLLEKLSGLKGSAADNKKKRGSIGFGLFNK
ncbi:hypothetical protein JKP88DRAFT_187998 [Tribonema minus]|uniref:Uncharacterized protein n=1 Tax=Tribonema minus TaxID=303371 RepID=A0A835YPT5_9STRA|nr:hypothetical protein JKP88DRAFT_187998 [Tribonema minus]